MHYRIALRMQQALVLEARLAMPNEACGFVVGHSHEGAIEFTAYQLAQNISALPTKEFLIDGTTFRKAVNRAERCCLVLGIWHSHPTGQPTPSTEDYALIKQLSGIPFMIVGVNYCLTIYECEGARVREAERFNVFDSTIVEAFHHARD